MLKLNLTKLRSAFSKHKAHAAERGVTFELTFEQWLRIWIDSGHLAERGRGKNKYCMARFEDKGPYAVGNVRIITCSENAKERVWTPSNKQRTEHSQFMTGKKYAQGSVRSDKQRAEQSQRMVGNQNASGHKVSNKSRAKISRRLTGNQNTLGWSPSNEQRINMSLAQKKRQERERLEREQRDEDL